MTIFADKNPIAITDETFTEPTLLCSEKVWVAKVNWTGVSTAAHKLMLEDKNGFRKIRLTADAPGSSGLMVIPFDAPVGHPILFNGLYISDLDSGNVDIYLAARGRNK